ncbi:ribonuclease H [Senna tora]|uniref:Ribonuclease H n=1 Tax=Senna tora TaxID=362788 RepID=A0A834WNP4_9FABA|nr:ribonuclease H [Senna tora]
MCTMIRRKKNRIEALTNDDGDLVYDNETLKDMATYFFRTLYTEEELVRTILDVSGMFPNMPDGCIENCSKPFTMEEVKEAIFSMGPLKAPGPDGINPLFVQSLWETFKESIKILIEEVFLNPRSLEEINQTIIVLIPKVQAPTSVRLRYNIWRLDWARFEYLIPMEIRNKIASIPTPKSDGSEDKPAWRHSNDGRFSVKSTYKFLKGCDRIEQSINWRNIWNWKRLERVKSFLWLCGHNKILTNAARRHRGMGSDESCLRCGVRYKDLLHVLRDCFETINFWMRLVKYGQWLVFFNLDRQE